MRDALVQILGTVLAAFMAINVAYGQACTIEIETYLYKHAIHSKQTHKLPKLDSGTIVNYLYKTGDFYKVRYDGLSGYVSIYSVKCFLPNKPYNTWIRTSGNKYLKKGVLVEAFDGEVNFIPKSKYKGWLYNREYSLETIPVSDIDVLKFRKKGKIGKGALIGGLAAPLGAVVGAIAFIPKIKIPLNGDHSTYQKELERIKKYDLPDH